MKIVFMTLIYSLNFRFYSIISVFYSLILSLCSLIIMGSILIGSAQ